MKTTNRWRFAWAAATLLASTMVSAQDYPASGKVIHFVIGFPAGSTIDNVSRVIVENIQARTGATIVVDDKAGALGIIGMDNVSGAAADGYTMMPSSSATNSSGPFLSRAARRVDAVNGFSHIGRMVRFDILVVTKAGEGFQNAAHLIAVAKTNPTKVTYGYGSGTGQVAAAAFCRAAQIQVPGIPYKGQPPALVDLIGGQIGFVAADLGAVLPQVRSGTLTAVALLSDQRSTILPGVPTTKELGLGDMNLRGWIGVAGPRGLPPDVVRWWETQLTASMAVPEVRKRLLAIGVEPDLLLGAPFRRFVQDQYDAWGRQIHDAGIEPK